MFGFFCAHDRAWEKKFDGLQNRNTPKTKITSFSGRNFSDSVAFKPQQTPMQWTHSGHAT